MAVKPDAAIGEMQFARRLLAAERIDERVADRLRGDTRRTAVGADMHQMRMRAVQVAGINPIFTGFNTRMHLPVGTGDSATVAHGQRVVLRLGCGCVTRQRMQCVAAALRVWEAKKPGTTELGQMIKVMITACFALRDAYTCLQQQVAEGVVVFGAKERDGFVEDEVHGFLLITKKQEKQTPCRGGFPCG